MAHGLHRFITHCTFSLDGAPLFTAHPSLDSLDILPLRALGFSVNATRDSHSVSIDGVLPLPNQFRDGAHRSLGDVRPTALPTWSSTQPDCPITLLSIQR